MKTFGLFTLLFVLSLVVSFIAFAGAPTDGILKVIFGTQFAYILYKLGKEEYKS
jgi:hypothetical protein